MERGGREPNHSRFGSKRSKSMEGPTFLSRPRWPLNYRQLDCRTFLHPPFRGFQVQKRNRPHCQSGLTHLDSRHLVRCQASFLLSPGEGAYYLEQPGNHNLGSCPLPPIVNLPPLILTPAPNPHTDTGATPYIHTSATYETTDRGQDKTNRRTVRSRRFIRGYHHVELPLVTILTLDIWPRKANGDRKFVPLGIILPAKDIENIEIQGYGEMETKLLRACKDGRGQGRFGTNSP